MNHDERTLENLERENYKLKQDLFNKEQECKGAWDLVRRHEENQRLMIADIEKLNALQRKDIPVLRHKEASDQEAYEEAENQNQI